MKDGQYCCIECKSEHNDYIVSHRSEFWHGKRKMCCMDGLARAVSGEAKP